ncbi:MAG TPA: nucleotidyltransferase [Steroidobacteraceae bacterium]|nr:nucleotidyltransferase [Steroidobacteraceae bacterium]
MTELNQLLQRLCDADIEFVIVGGFAAMLHGSSMLTRDLDVCALLTDVNVAKLRDTFRDLHPTHRFTPQKLSFLEHPDPGVPLKNLYLQTDLGPIDLLGAIAGFDSFDDIKKNAVAFGLFGRKVHVISIEDLVKAKEALGRHKDLLVAQELRAIIEKTKK